MRKRDWTCIERRSYGGRDHSPRRRRTPAKIRLAQAAMGKPETNVSALCRELGITSQRLYRYVSHTGALRADGKKG